MGIGNYKQVLTKVPCSNTVRLIGDPIQASPCGHNGVMNSRLLCLERGNSPPAVSSSGNRRASFASGEQRNPFSPNSYPYINRLARFSTDRPVPRRCDML